MSLLSSSDDTGAGGGDCRHCHQDAVGVVIVITIEMLWGIVIIKQCWEWVGVVIMVSAGAGGHQVMLEMGVGVIVVG